MRNLVQRRPKFVKVTCALRRITIDSTRLSVAVMPFARLVKAAGLSAKVTPEPPFTCPFQARRMGATASRVNRALYGRNKGVYGTMEKSKRRYEQVIACSMYCYTDGTKKEYASKSG
jgi:hypothetical protein